MLGLFIGNINGNPSLRASVGLEYKFSNPNIYAYGTLGYRRNSADISTMGVDEKNIELVEVKNAVGFNYANLSAGLGYRFNINENINLSIEGGLLAGYMLSAKGKVENQEFNLFVAEDTKDSLNRSELSVSLSAALEYQRYFIRIGTEQGLTNVEKNEYGATKNTQVYLGVGIRF